MLGKITWANKINVRVKGKQKTNLLFWFIFVAHFNFQFANICVYFCGCGKYYLNKANILSTIEFQICMLLTYFRLKLNVFHLFYLNTVSAKKKVRKSLILNSFNSWNDVLIKIRYEKQYFCIIFLLLFNAIFDENTEILKSWKSYYISVRQSQ